MKHKLVYLQLIVFILIAHAISKAQDAGTFKDDRDGQVYKTVKIGKQLWLAENLNFKTDSSWFYGDKQKNGEIYGRLYNWESAKAACPSGWHLPSDKEWKQMEKLIGISDPELNIEGFRGRDKNIGGKLKSLQNWNEPNFGATNSTGFNAISAGYRSYQYYFTAIGDNADFWTSTEYNCMEAWYRGLNDFNAVVGRNYNYKHCGFSVRCIKD